MRLTKWLATLAASAVCAAPAADTLHDELAAIEKQYGGTLGVSVLRVKTGERAGYRGDERFPMASTFKVPLALKVLEQVDKRALSLAQVVPIDQRNLSPGSGELKTTDPDVEKSASLAELLELTLRNSDNTATDHLLGLVGGPAAVTRHVREMGVTDLEIDRPAMQLVADSWGFKLPPAGERTRRNLVRAQARAGPVSQGKGAQRTLADRRDTATPNAMVAIVERIVKGEGLSAASHAFLVEQMEKCRTGVGRLKAGFPKGMVVAHKTGTLTRVVTADVGYVKLPFGGGELIVAAFLKGSPQPIAAQEKALAAVAQAVYRRLT